MLQNVSISVRPGEVVAIVSVYISQSSPTMPLFSLEFIGSDFENQSVMFRLG